MKTYWIKAEIESGFPFIKRGRLQEWINKHYIEPWEPATQGKTAKFSRDNLYQIWIFHHLLKYGANRESAADFLHNLQRRDPKPKYLLITEAEGETRADSQGFELCDNAPNFQPHLHKIFLVINLDTVRCEVDKAFG